MEMLGRIRRMYLRDKLSLHEIAKRTGLSRNTVRSWLRAPEEVKAPVYERKSGFSKLSEHVAELERALKADAQRPKQDRRTARALFAQIKASGYEGGYTRVTDFIRGWRAGAGKGITAYVPLKFELGEAFQFDWSEEGLVVGGIYHRLQVSHMKLCASRAFWLVAYPSQALSSAKLPNLCCCASSQMRLRLSCTFFSTTPFSQPLATLQKSASKR